MEVWNPDKESNTILFIRHALRESVRIRSFSGPYFPAFGLIADTFHAVMMAAIDLYCSCITFNFSVVGMHMPTGNFSDRKKGWIQRASISSLFSTLKLILKAHGNFNEIPEEELKKCFNLTCSLRSKNFLEVVTKCFIVPLKIVI